MLCLQVCCQPSFAAVEAGLQSIQYYSGSPQRGSPAACTEGRAGNSRRVWFAILASRCAYVAFTTLIAAALPFFAVILGLVASLTLYQTAMGGRGDGTAAAYAATVLSLPHYRILSPHSLCRSLGLPANEVQTTT